MRDPVCKRCGDRVATVGAHKVPARMLREIIEGKGWLSGWSCGWYIEATATRYGLSVEWSEDLRWASFKDGGSGELRFVGDLLLLRGGHDYALDPDAVEGWCKQCHDRESGQEAHRQARGGCNLPGRDRSNRRGCQKNAQSKFEGGGV